METIIRVVKDRDADPFARIDKVPINDNKRSFKALGILVYVLSKPDGWQVNIKDLDNHATDGEKAIRSGIKELVDLKYCRPCKIVDPDNKRIRKWIYIFYERPYPGKLLPVLVIEGDPVTQNGKVDDPDPQKPLAGFPQVEKPQVENGPPINKVFKEQKNISTNEVNNNNTKRGGAAADPIVVVEGSIIKKQKYKKLKNRILALGWAGSLDEITRFFNQDPDYVLAHVEQIESLPGLENPAGLLRKNLRSGTRPLTKAEKEQARRRRYLDDEYADHFAE